MLRDLAVLRRRPQAGRAEQHDQHHREADTAAGAGLRLDRRPCRRCACCAGPTDVAQHLRQRGEQHARRGSRRGCGPCRRAPPSPAPTIDSISVNDSGRDEALERREHRAGDAAEGRAHREREQLQVAGVDAHRLGRDLVLADRHPGAADARVLQARYRSHDHDARAAGTGSSSLCTDGNVEAAETRRACLPRVDTPKMRDRVDHGDALRTVGDVDRRVRLFRKMRMISPKPSVTIAR